jgi:hypothetical protein
LTTLLYLAAKSAHVGVDVDELACLMHIPMAYSRQTRDRASCQALSYPIAAVGGGVSLGEAKAPSLDIW